MQASTIITFSWSLENNWTKINSASYCWVWLNWAFALLLLTWHIILERLDAYSRVMEFSSSSHLYRVRSTLPTSSPWALRLWALRWRCTSRPCTTCFPPRPSLTTSSTCGTSPGSSWGSASSRRNRWRTKRSSSGKNRIDSFSFVCVSFMFVCTFIM